MKKAVSILRSFGFTKVHWDKCPQGFKKAGYPCYSNKSGAWVELYLSDTIPYGRISANGLTSPDKFGGIFFDSDKQLITFLKQQADK